MKKLSRKQEGGQGNYSEYLNTKFPRNINTYDQVFKNIGNSMGIDPSFLYANAMGEGLVLGAKSPNGWENTDQYTNAVKINPDIYKGYGFDAARMLGMDNIGKTLPLLIQKGYLPSDFSSNMVPYDFVTQKNEKTQSGAFKNPYTALQAQAAYLKMNRDDVRAYAKSKNIHLTPEQEDFFTSATYNGGSANMNGMMDSYNKRGYLKDNKFIMDPNFKIPSDAYPQIYNNIAPRIRSSREITAKLKKGGTITNTGYLPDSPDRFNEYHNKIVSIELHNGEIYTGLLSVNNNELELT